MELKLDTASLFFSFRFGLSFTKMLSNRVMATEAVPKYSTLSTLHQQGYVEHSGPFLTFPKGGNHLRGGQTMI